MNTKNKRLSKYIFVTIIYSYILSLFNIFTNFSDYWALNWFTNDTFVFQFIIIFLIGCSIIDNWYNSLFFSRFSTRKEIVFSHIFDYVIFAFILTSVLFCSVIIILIFINIPVNSDMIIIFLKNYLRFFFGSCLTGIFSLNIFYSNLRFPKQFVHILTFLILASEITILIPSLSNLLNINVFFFFTWIFFDISYISYAVIIFFTSILLFLILKKIKKVDLPI